MSKASIGSVTIQQVRMRGSVRRLVLHGIAGIAFVFISLRGCRAGQPETCLLFNTGAAKGL
jgi:hypothetical protein